MSVSAATTKTIVAGDGSTTSFTYTFALPAGSTGSDVECFVVDNLGNVTLLASNYSIDTATSVVTYPTVGGVAPLGSGVNALPIGWEFVMARVEPLAQDLSLNSQGLFSLPAIEAALDYMMYCLQQMQEQLNRCVMLPINTPGSSAPPAVAPSAGVLITYNAPFATLQGYATAAPTVQFWGYATDQNQLYFYSADTSIGTGGFIAA